MASIIEMKASVNKDGRLVLELPEEFREATVSVFITRKSEGDSDDASDSYTDRDEEEIDFRLQEVKRQAAQSALETVLLPDYVVRTMFEFGRDWFGDEAIDVTVVLTDKAGRSTRYQRLTTAIEELFRPVFMQLGPDWSPKIKFITETRQRKIEDKMRLKAQGKP